MPDTGLDTGLLTMHDPTVHEPPDVGRWLLLLRDGTEDEQRLARTELGLILEGRGLLDDAAEAYARNVADGAPDRRPYERLAALARQRGDVETEAATLRALADLLAPPEPGPDSVPEPDLELAAAAGADLMGPIDLTLERPAEDLSPETQNPTPETQGQNLTRPTAGGDLTPPAPLPCRPRSTGAERGEEGDTPATPVVEARVAEDDTEAGDNRNAAGEDGDATGKGGDEAGEGAEPAEIAPSFADGSANAESASSRAVADSPAGDIPPPAVDGAASEAQLQPSGVSRWALTLCSLVVAAVVVGAALMVPVSRPLSVAPSQPAGSPAPLEIQLSATAPALRVLLSPEPSPGASPSPLAAVMTPTAAASPTPALSPLAARCTDAALRFPESEDTERAVRMAFRAYLARQGVTIDPASTLFAGLSDAYAERHAEVVAGWMAVTLQRERRGLPTFPLVDYVASDVVAPSGPGAYQLRATVSPQGWSELRNAPAATCEGAFFANPANARWIELMQASVGDITWALPTPQPRP